ncbi:hypothetical protein CEXT_712381 [Caerostris extrusa]|uniref:Uncharacterized protein n=1 Tax=Caerostris extrusa TaxID=172846 RepID=A0AAV4VT08_CAEEX|nr:hypothetical protein CEXT_712381 [Caerostris extrusa]
MHGTHHRGSGSTKCTHSCLPISLVKVSNGGMATLTFSPTGFQIRRFYDEAKFFRGLKPLETGGDWQLDGNGMKKENDLSTHGTSRIVS